MLTRLLVVASSTASSSIRQRCSCSSVVSVRFGRRKTGNPSAQQLFPQRERFSTSQTHDGISRRHSSSTAGGGDGDESAPPAAGAGASRSGGKDSPTARDKDKVSKSRQEPGAREKKQDADSDSPVMPGTRDAAAHRRSGRRRARRVDATAEGKPVKEPKDVDTVDKDLLDAASAVASKLHEHDNEMKKKTMDDLISKLKRIERTSFDIATAATTAEMKADAVNAIININETLQGVKISAPSNTRAQDLRRSKRGLLAIRRDIFDRAVKSGYSDKEASKVAERAYQMADEQLQARFEGRPREAAEAAKQRAQVQARDEKEAEFFEEAQAMADNILYELDWAIDRAQAGGVGASWEAKRGPDISPDANAPNIFDSEPALGLFDAAKAKPTYALRNWTRWEDDRARINNQQLGPRNAFEEMIEWTNQGKLWPYPIDNELGIGEEAEVPFHEHIFLERHLERLSMPRDGPVAHFMHLVCVGLSKNPYMTVRKKIEHLNWFGEYFTSKASAIERMMKMEESLDAEIAARAQQREAGGTTANQASTPSGGSPAQSG